MQSKAPGSTDPLRLQAIHIDLAPRRTAEVRPESAPAAPAPATDQVDITSGSRISGDEKSSASPARPATLAADSPAPPAKAAPSPFEANQIQAGPLEANLRTLTVLDGDRLFSQGTPMNDQLRLGDGFDASRDITGIEAREGRPDQPYTFSVSMAYLKSGAESGNLDVYLLLGLGKAGTTRLPDQLRGSAQPWNLALGAYDQKNFSVVDGEGKSRPGVLQAHRFDSLRNRVEFSIDKEALRDLGWKDGTPLALQAFTAKDLSGTITDSLDMPGAKPWQQDGRLERSLATDQVAQPLPLRDRNWQDDIIYFVLTDRFADGDKTNNQGVVADDLKKYHGGDLEGIIQNLDYIKSLGASAIWISPVMDSQNTFYDSDGYHGYWPIDFQKVDEHQGDLDKFKEMVDKAHAKGLKVILDLPLNQVAWEHPWMKDPAKAPWLHHNGDIVDWNNPDNVETGSMFGLPDLAQENPPVADYLVGMSKWWIKETGIDGFRLDAVRHVPRDFWKRFDREIHEFAGPDFLLLGEDMHGAADHVGSYQKDGMESLFDLPLYFKIRDVFAHDGSMRQLAGHLASSAADYDNPSQMAALLDNHDLNRFITEAGDNGREKFKLALAFLMTLDRIPTIYYGTETGMEGEHIFGKDPTNRADMDWNANPDLKQYFTRLTSIRNGSSALSEGRFLEMWQDEKVFAFDRWHQDQEAVVVLSNSSAAESREIPLRSESGIPDGTVLRNALGEDTVVVQNGKIKIDLNPREPKIFIVDKK